MTMVNSMEFRSPVMTIYLPSSSSRDCLGWKDSLMARRTPHFFSDALAKKMCVSAFRCCVFVKVHFLCTHDISFLWKCFFPKRKALGWVVEAFDVKR